MTSCYSLSSINRGDLRRNAIHLLQSLLGLPLQFANMPIKELVPGADRSVPLTNFNHLKPRIVNLLVNALQVETETINAQMLIGCLMFLVQDAAALEEAEMRQTDGYSESSARNSNNVFTAGNSFKLMGRRPPQIHLTSLSMTNIYLPFIE